MDDATSLGSRRLYSDQFTAIVKQVLASMPAVRIAPEDIEAAAADLARRLIAVYPYPRQRGLVGMRAIIDHYGMDSSMGLRARFRMGLHDFGIRYRESAGSSTSGADSSGRPTDFDSACNTRSVR